MGEKRKAGKRESGNLSGLTFGGSEMGMDYFIAYSLADKLALLKGLTEAMLTGQVVRVRTSRDSETEFTRDATNDLNYARLCDSIANDDAFDANNPIQGACARNQRPGTTRVNFC